jgi:WD40 repeat protein
LKYSLENAMHKKPFTVLMAVCLLIACGLMPAVPTGTAFIPPTVIPPTVEPPTPTTTATSTQAPPTDTPPAYTGLQFIAYVQDGQLLVTNVSNGVIGGTTQYTATGQADKVMDIAWSPSGEFVAFVSSASGDPHIFYIYALGDSTPTDLGPGSSPAWSPDSKSIAYIGGTYPDQNIFMTTIDSPEPQQLTSETNHAWGRPAFTPNGTALVVTNADRYNMGASGNTSFDLEELALDGSGTRTPLPSATTVDGARLPYDLRFSPDGTRLAYSTSYHLSACASPGAYYVSDPDGGDRKELMSPTFKAMLDPNKELYHVGLNYAWLPGSDALVASGTVVDCDFNSPNMGKAVAGPQMSILKLDGSEGLVIPGMFWSISVDRTGKLVAAAHYKDLGDQNPVVEIYSAQTARLMLSVGSGSNPQLQP